MFRIRLASMVAGGALAAAFTVVGSAPAAAAGAYVCSGGSPSSPSVIPAGTYASIVVTGFCTPAPGTITVHRSLTVARGAGFASGDASSTVSIGGNVNIQPGGKFELGCGPSFDAPCPEGANVVSSDRIGGNLGAEHATLVVVHYDIIGGNVGVAGGGGGLSCNNLPGLDTAPFIDFASNSIGRNASITGLRTCWAGFSANRVAGNVSWDSNVTGTPDGNYIGNNNIARNLSCFGNSPDPHLSDLGPDPNSVSGHTEGQCVSLI